MGDVFDCIAPFKIKDHCPRHSYTLPVGTRFSIYEKTGTLYTESRNGQAMVRYVLMSFGCFHKVVYNAINTRRVVQVKVPTDPHLKEPDDPGIEDDLLDAGTHE